MAPSPQETAARPFPWRRVLAFSTALWCGATLVDWAKDSIAAALLDQPVGWHLLRASALWWPLFIPLTVGVLALAHRLPMRRDRWLRAAAVHVPAAVAFALTHLLLTRVVVLWRHDILTLELLSRQWRVAFASFFLFDTLVYIALVSGYWARDYYLRYRDRAVAAAELQRLAATARFEALRWQLNPHFLFNSLNTVAGLVRAGNADGAVDMLARISALLRSTLDDATAADVPLAKELELVDLYAAIERVRFRDRLTVDMRVDDDVLDARVPALILQPLVENAVRHGVAHTSDAVRVDIAATRTADGLRVTVRDTGGGFPDGAAAVTEGVGLSNTRARLTHRFGTAARIELASADGGGGQVTLDMPYEPSQEAA